jgi:hypothetical protein
MGEVPFMIDTGEKVRGCGGGDSHLKGLKSLGMGDGMGVVAEMIGGPRGFWGWGDVG